MIVKGVSWTPIGLGIFMSTRFKYDLTAFVTGSRGDWAWLVERRPPPKFLRESIFTGHARTKVEAMVAAAEAVKATTGAAQDKEIAQAAGYTVATCAFGHSDGNPCWHWAKPAPGGPIDAALCDHGYLSAEAAWIGCVNDNGLR